MAASLSLEHNILTSVDSRNNGSEKQLRVGQLVLDITPDQRGVFEEIDKFELRGDPAYQRDQDSKRKIILMAKTWSWVACGSIVVADRNGDYYVVDGMHRVEAAKIRPDIVTIPSMVFKVKDQEAEARGFYRVNANRKPLTSVQSFRALLCSHDETAMFVNSLIAQAGREPKKQQSSTTVACVGSLMAAATERRADLVRIWPVIVKLCDGEPMHERIIHGLLYLESKMPEGSSLSDQRWAARIFAVGVDMLLREASKVAAVFARGGAKVYASGFVNAINKGLREGNKLPIDLTF